ncbi:MAG: glycine cleavage system protein H [Candidatus Latescibacterota bacterium]
MEGFHHVDLFATKGAEYLLVLGFLALLVFYWRVLNRPARPAQIPAPVPAAGGAGWFEVRNGVFYHPGHTWAMPLQGSTVRIGLDDFAQKLLGTPERVSLPQPGTALGQGEQALNLTIGSRAIPLLSPVDGEVVAVNEEVVRSPELVNRDPYGQGWLVEVRGPRVKANLKGLLSGRLALSWMEATAEGLRRRISGELGLAMQDGGVPVSGMAQSLSADHWEEVAADFLLTR